MRALPPATFRRWQVYYGAKARPGKGGDYWASYEARANNRRSMAKLGYLSVFTLSNRTPTYAGTSSGASSSSTIFIMVTDGLRSEAIFSRSKLTTSPRTSMPLPLLAISASCDVLDPVVSLVEHGPVRRYRRSTSAQHGKDAPPRIAYSASPGAPVAARSTHWPPRVVKGCGRRRGRPHSCGSVRRRDARLRCTCYAPHGSSCMPRTGSGG